MQSLQAQKSIICWSVRSVCLLPKMSLKDMFPWMCVFFPLSRVFIVKGFVYDELFSLMSSVYLQGFHSFGCLSFLIRCKQREHFSVLECYSSVLNRAVTALTSQPRWMDTHRQYCTRRHITSPRVQTGAVERLNPMLRQASGST